MTSPRNSSNSWGFKVVLVLAIGALLFVGALYYGIINP